MIQVSILSLRPKDLTVAIQNKQLVCITFQMVSIRTSPVHQWALFRQTQIRFIINDIFEFF
jgi:hypothetical protein